MYVRCVHNVVQLQRAVKPKSGGGGGGEKRVLGTLCRRLCIRYALRVNAGRAEGRTTIVELAHTRPRAKCRTDRDRPATPSRVADWSAECTASRPTTDGVGQTKRSDTDTDTSGGGGGVTNAGSPFYNAVTRRDNILFIPTRFLFSEKNKTFFNIGVFLQYSFGRA